MDEGLQHGNTRISMILFIFDPLNKQLMVVPRAESPDVA